METLKNKKGFTLIELLAVIVILALIMSIAIISMNGVMQNSKYSIFKESAMTIIDGVRQHLSLADELQPGDYYFNQSILEQGGQTSPLGGDIQYISSNPGSGYTQIGTFGIYRSANAGECTATSPSFVRVRHDGVKYVYSICLTAGAGNKYIDVTNGTLENLMNVNNTSMILPKDE